MFVNSWDVDRRYLWWCCAFPCKKVVDVKSCGRRIRFSAADHPAIQTPALQRGKATLHSITTEPPPSYATR